LLAILGTKQLFNNMEKLVSESLEELNEKLKGKQYKIDADKNKKITKNDFKLLRKKKKEKDEKETE